MVSLWHGFDRIGGAVRPAVPAHAETRGRAWRGELLSPHEARVHVEPWRDLAARTLAPNPFLEPELALAAAIHLAHGRPPRFLFLWENASPGRLLAVAALAAPALGGLGPARLWLVEPMLAGPPLLDRDDAESAIEALIAALPATALHARGLVVPRIDAASPFAVRLQRMAARGRLAIMPLAGDDRPDTPQAPPARPAGARTVASRPKQVRDAVEHFMAIEASGPRGRDGTATLMSPSRSAFLRVATRALAHKRRCRVALTSRDGEPVAANILIGPRGAELCWKSTSIEGMDATVRERPTADWLILPPGSPPALLAAATRHRLARRLRGLASWTRR